MQNATELPSLRDELDRKTLEALDWIVRGVEAGQLTQESARTAAAAVFQAVSGLLSPEIADAFNQVLAGLGPREKDAVLRRVFYDDDRMAVVSWVVGSGVVKVAMKLPHTTSLKDFTYDDPADAKARFESLCETFELRVDTGLMQEFA